MSRLTKRQVRRTAYTTIAVVWVLSLVGCFLTSAFSEGADSGWAALSGLGFLFTSCGWFFWALFAGVPRLAEWYEGLREDS